MTLLEALFSPDLLVATLVHLTLLPTLLAGFAWLGQHTQGIPVTDWLLEHLGHPLARAAVLIVFVLIAYPAVFGLTQAPAWTDLLGAETGRLQTLLNWVFLASLLLPLLPLIGTMPTLILPIQGMVACALLFSWLAQWQGLGSVSPWPDGQTLGLVVLTAGLTHGLARLGARPAGAWINRRFDLSDGEAVAFEGLILLGQVPLLLLYGLNLGPRLTA